LSTLSSFFSTLSSFFSALSSFFSTLSSFFSTLSSFFSTLSSFFGYGGADLELVYPTSYWNKNRVKAATEGEINGAPEPTRLFVDVKTGAQ